MSAGSAWAAELAEEGARTRKVLERIPADKFSWQPHSKSTTFGGLASHVAQLPSWVESMVGMDELAMPADQAPPPAGVTSTEELVAFFDENLKKAVSVLESASDDALAANWRMKVGDEVVIEGPRNALLRRWLLNHMIHHRGQLTVYPGISVLPAPDGPFIHPRAAERTKLCSSHNRPAPEAVTSARADVRPTGAPAFRAFLRHRSTLVPFLRQAGFVALAARQPAGTGSAQILRSMSPNSRRVRCPSASRSQ